MKSLKLLACALVLSSCGRTPAKLGIDQALASYASTKDGIRLADGRLLNFVCMGRGLPTVILTAGLGDFSGWAWSSVQPAIARTTKVCAWDRPGFGMSDGSAVPQNASTTTGDLEAALATGKIPGPYVMVSHSLGSYESLLFADRHPEQVAGMVLIEPSSPGDVGTDDEANPVIKKLRNCAAQIRSGKLGPGSDDPDRCVSYPLVFPPVLSSAFKNKALANPLQYESQASFGANIARSSRLAVNANRNYGAMPLVVLSAVWKQPWLLTLVPQALRKRIVASHARNGRGHQALAALSTRGVHQRIPDTNHYLQKTQPKVVVDAVATVVAEARSTHPR